MNPDLINALFPLVGSAFILLNIRTLLKDKDVKGIHWISPLFFYCGQIWNCYFMWSLGQMFSFFAVGFMTALNLVWYSLMVFYKVRRA